MSLPSSAPTTLAGAKPEPGGSDAGEPKTSAPPSPAATEQAAAIPLSPEEQMALYEKDLQENDWGHQPC